MPPLHRRRDPVRSVRLLAPALNDQSIFAVLVGIDATDLALDSLLDQSPQEPRTVLAEGRRQVGVDAEVVFVAVAQSKAVGPHKVGAHLAPTDQTFPVVEIVRVNLTTQECLVVDDLRKL